MKRITIAIAALVVGLAFTSCKKYGCTDPDALNFEDNVRSNNLLCTYNGSILFWYDELIQDSLNALYNIQALEYYVEDVRADSLEFENPLEKPPVCGASEVATYTIDSTTGNKRWVEYQIFTELGVLLYDSTVEITANECLKIRLD
ncbi:MAG: hypothetical protein R3279_13710 [Putridiphycobacter sp.]|nr:hypothetical protein [Putridiphycobacter sp.]